MKAPAAPRTAALLVDDDARLGALVTEYLAKNDIDVTVAGDGERGLATLGRGRFDVVLLDVMLPGIDGLEVCRRLRAAPAPASCRSSCSPPRATTSTRSSASSSAPTTTSPSRSTRASSWRACARCCGARGQARRPSASAFRVGELEIDFERARGHGRAASARCSPTSSSSCWPRWPRAAGRVLSREHLLDAAQGRGARDVRPLDRRPHLEAARQARARPEGAALHQDRARRRLRAGAGGALMRARALLPHLPALPRRLLVVRARGERSCSRPAGARHVRARGWPSGWRGTWPRWSASASATAAARAERLRQLRGRARPRRDGARPRRRASSRRAAASSRRSRDGEAADGARRARVLDGAPRGRRRRRCATAPGRVRRATLAGVAERRFAPAGACCGPCWCWRLMLLVVAARDGAAGAPHLAADRAAHRGQPAPRRGRPVVPHPRPSCARAAVGRGTITDVDELARADAVVERHGGARRAAGARPARAARQRVARAALAAGPHAGGARADAQRRRRRPRACATSSRTWPSSSA